MSLIAVTSLLCLFFRVWRIRKLHVRSSCGEHDCSLHIEIFYDYLRVAFKNVNKWTCQKWSLVLPRCQGRKDPAAAFILSPTYNISHVFGPVCFPNCFNLAREPQSADRIISFYVAVKKNILVSRDGGANLFASSPLTGWRQGAAGAAAAGSLTCYQGAVYHC